MIKALFNVIINLLATVIQIVVWPVNTLITNALPDLSDKILLVTNTLNSMFDGITWPLGFLPGILISTLEFILLVEIAKHTIFKGTHVLVKVWSVLQKIKFW